ncbi:hypothetical protein [Elizabethkingia miricola]|nr:hypothetical protein [Elizabethkingia miricola]
MKLYCIANNAMDLYSAVITKKGMKAIKSDNVSLKSRTFSKAR